MPPSDAELPSRVGRAEKIAVAAALNLIEDRRPSALPRIEALLHALAAEKPADFGQRVGLTGPPGVGKSTLTAALARKYRELGRSVGVLAVDPSSTRSGGALLGDRARMSFDPEDTGLFVRSLATAGEAGGLAHAANAAVEVLATAYDRVLVETTGVGQTETDVEHVVDTVCLVIQPGSGDVLQFIKAGIMEI
ncbi:MAG: GTP-binding protein, partial [Polyangiales bacterium]